MTNPTDATGTAADEPPVWDIGDLVTVRLIDFPVDLQQRAAVRYDALMREFALIRSGEDDDSVPNRLLHVVDDLTSRFSGFSDLPSAEIEAARIRGDEYVDLEYTLPSAAGAAAAQFDQLLEEANDYCRAGQHLVTLQEAEDTAAFRRWFLREFTEQVAGATPTPFTAGGGANGDGAAHAAPPDRDDNDEAMVASARVGASATAVIVFEGELDIATAETLRREVNEHRDAGADRIVIDASNMTFIDSVGLSIVIALNLRLAETGASLILRSPSRAVLRMLEIAGLTNRLVIEDGD